MATEKRKLNGRNKGFTLLETLIALAIVSTIIATLIPIARTTLDNLIIRENEYRIISTLSSRIQTVYGTVDNSISGTDAIVIRESRTALAPFEYEKDQKEIWQPILVRIEASDAAGQLQKFEFIRLERQSP